VNDKLTANAKIIGLVGLALAGFYIASNKTKRTHGKALYKPGDTVMAVMGQLFTVRLPRGDYQVAADKITQTTSIDLGDSTDVVLLVGFAHAEYKDRVTFLQQGTGKQYIVNVNAQPPRGG